MASATASPSAPPAGTPGRPFPKMYLVEPIVQPVPLAEVPGSGGVLPSWERKKLELDMSNATLEDGTGPSSSPAGAATSVGRTDGDLHSPTSGTISSPIQGQRSDDGLGSRAMPLTSAGSTAIGTGTERSDAAGTATSTTAPGNGAIKKLHKPINGSSSSSASGSGVAGTAASQRPGFLETLRRVSSSKRSVHESDHNSRTGQSRPAVNGAAAVSSSPAQASRKKKGGNPLLQYLRRHFSASHSGTAGSGSKSASYASQHPSRGVGYIKPDNSTAAGSGGLAAAKTKKTRSGGFAQKMREASGKMTTRIQQQFRRMNSKTPKEELPKTWDEWRTAYARGEIDVNDMPDPPPRAEGETEPTPYEAQFFPAPLPPDHRQRVMAFNRLDIEGKRGVKGSQVPVKEGEDPLPDNLEDHPAFRNIVSQARQLFNSSISILSVFNENRQLFLAETGLNGMKEVPREVTFCAHAVLQQPPGPFELPDIHKDWRFAGSPLQVQYQEEYGLRAYYGVPLLAPDFTGTSREQVPIGSLCIIDDKPRTEFTAEQRAKMGDLALLAQKTIANWSRARLQARLDAMENSFQAWKSETDALSGRQTAVGITSQPKAYNSISNIEQLPPSPGAGNDREVLHIKRQNDNLSVNGALTSPRVDGRRTSEDASAMESYHTAPNQLSNRQKIYDISTKLVANSLDLALVYILKLDLSTPSKLSDNLETSVKSLSLVSSYGLPSPEPAFDAVLHLKALRSEEGGLLYQNPNIDELTGGETLPATEDVEYASALLVPIYESDRTGYVLAGFTDDPERVFERDDLLYLTTIASELVVYLQD